jgi:hypothetical protein
LRGPTSQIFDDRDAQTLRFQQLADHILHGLVVDGEDVL